MFRRSGGGEQWAVRTSKRSTVRSPVRGLAKAFSSRPQAYTPHAVEFAATVEGLILVDGKRLTELMLEFGVGVSHRIIKVPKLDSDYFDV